jgi:uncharacterized membrane protein
MPEAKPKPVLLSAGLPPAAYFEAIERVLPGSAKQLLDAFESETAHRRALEESAQKAEIAFRFRGQLFGFLSCLATFGVALYAAYCQQAWIGSIVGGTTIVGLVSIFVLGRLVGDRKGAR